MSSYRQTDKEEAPSTLGQVYREALDRRADAMAPVDFAAVYTQPAPARPQVWWRLLTQVWLAPVPRLVFALVASAIIALPIVLTVVHRPVTDIAISPDFQREIKLFTEDLIDTNDYPRFDLPDTVVPDIEPANIVDDWEVKSFVN